MGISGIGSVLSSLGSSASKAVTSAVSSASSSGWLDTGKQVLDTFLSGASGASGSTQGGESTEDQTKAMIDNFIFENLKKMREESSAKLQEAMKKTTKG